MPRWNRQNNRIAIDRCYHQLRRRGLDRQANNSNIEAAAADVLKLMKNSELVQPEFNQRIGGAIARDCTGENPRKYRRSYKPDFDVAELTSPGLLCHQDRALDLLQCPDGFAKHDLPRGSEPYRPLRSKKELHTDISFQRLNLLRQRRLGNPKTLCRTSKMQFFRQDGHRFESLQVHHDPLRHTSLSNEP